MRTLLFYVANAEPIFDYEKLDVYALLARIVAMLTRPVERFDPDEFRVREDGINQ
jgi:hypothetical protein